MAPHNAQLFLFPIDLRDMTRELYPTEIRVPMVPMVPAVPGVRTVRWCLGCQVQGLTMSIVQKWLWVFWLSGAVAAQAPPHLPPPVLSESQASGRVEGLDRALPPVAEGIYQALSCRVDAEVAMATVRRTTPLQRFLLPGRSGTSRESTA